MTKILSSIKYHKLLYSKKPKIEITYNYYHDLQSIPEFEKPLDNSELRSIDCKDIHLLHDVWPVDLEKMQFRLVRGDKCYAMFIDGRMAHYQWIQTSGSHRIQRAGRDISIHDGEIMVYHARVATWARGNRINPYVKSTILREYKVAGYRGAWVYTTRENIASQKGIERTGWKFIEGYRAINIGDRFFIPLPGTFKNQI